MNSFEPRRNTSGSGHMSIAKKVLVVMLLFGATGMGYFVWMLIGKKDNQPAAVVATSDASSEPEHEDEVLALSDSKFREFTQEEFRLFYDNLLQPNLSSISTPPFITGDDVADTRIRQLALNRGYKLRNSPEGNLSTVDGFPIQPPVVKPWKELQAAALRDGHELSITSAYRSEADQRKLFIDRLANEGVTIQQVAGGNADEAVVKVLTTTAIPGYSKHHTGYTVDLLCAGYAFESFSSSSCFRWMKENNYERIKEFGFIPSYPEESALQGPDPEAWEYVYVGRDVLSR